MVRQRKEARHLVGVDVGEFLRTEPGEEFVGVFLVLRLLVDAHADVRVVRDIALVAGLAHGRVEGAQFQLRVLLEVGDVPGAGRIDGGLAQRELVLAVAIGLRAGALGQIAAQPGFIFPGGDELRIGKLGLARDQRLAAILALPVIGADAGKHHLVRLPLVGRAQRQRRILAALLDRFEHLEEFLFRGGRLQFQFAEDFLVVQETMHDGGDRHAEGVLAIVRLPRHLGRGREVVHAGLAVELFQLAPLVQGQRDVERAAGQQVARRAAAQARVQRGIVFGGGGGRKLDLDARMLFLEGGDEHRFPQGLVVHAPAFDGERARLRRAAGQQQGQQCVARGHAALCMQSHDVSLLVLVLFGCLIRCSWRTVASGEM